MKNTIIAIALLSTLSGCGPKDIIFGHEGKVKLDNSYRFYARKVYRRVAASGENITQANPENKIVKQNLLEVQFMLLSPKHKSAIYMSMKPDLWGKHYQHYSDSTLNLDDVDRIQFGKIKQNDPTNGQVRFFAKDGYSATTWELSTESDSLTVRRIQYWLGEYDSTFMKYGIANNEVPWEFLESEINVDEALREQVVFKRTSINCLGLDGISFPIPIDSHFAFRQRAGRKHRVSVEYKLAPEYTKTYGSKHIRSTPIPLIQQ
jgi:hypothetical protein